MLYASRVHFRNIQDTKITDGVDTTIKIENVINQVKPDIIFTHSGRDLLQDHRNAASASLSEVQSSHKNREP